jgi:hypothetical protein
MENVENENVQPTDEGTIDHFEKIKDLISVNINNTTDIVTNNIVDKFVNAEIEKRTSLAITAYEKLEKLQTEFKKLKPDIVNVSEDGVETVSYSKNKWDEKKKTEQQISNLKVAINNALNKNEYEKLSKLLNG